jgi:hypothetical protein
VNPVFFPSEHGFLYGLRRAVLDYYVRNCQESFWGVYGWTDTPIVIYSPHVSHLVRYGLKLVTIAVVSLSLVSLTRSTWRLSKLARRRGAKLALELAARNTPMNSFFVFTALMLVLHAATDNGFYAQGRNWFAFLMPMFLLGLVYAPRAFRRPRVRSYATAALATGLALYCLIGGHYAVRTIEERYYGPSAAVHRGFDVAAQLLAR